MEYGAMLGGIGSGLFNLYTLQMPKHVKCETMAKDSPPACWKCDL
jgi:hypothetical protein